MPNLKDKLTPPNLILNMQVNVIPSPVATQSIAAAGTDAVIIDMEHGAIGHAEAHAMITATQGTDCAPLIRIPELGETHVKRVLDLGAEGIVFPLVRTAEDARLAVAACRYPPHGTRGWGPFIAHSRWNTGLMDYESQIGDRTVVCLLLETAEAVENIDEICAVEGIDIMVIAPFDLSTSLGVSGKLDHPTYLAAEKKLEDAVLKSGIPLAGVALQKDRAQALLKRGYRITAGFDVLLLKAAIADGLSWIQ